MATVGARELQFIATLGHGGFGSVYLAHMRAGPLLNVVAVKVLRDVPGLTAEMAGRLRDEARLLGLLAHEHIVKVYALAEVEGRPAVVMEYVEGADLSAVLQAAGPLPLRPVVQVGASVAGALDAAWSARSPETGKPLRCVHRDIKPANLLLTPHGGLKVLDFGIARAEFSREGVSGSMAFGTPRYMAPEQWQGGEATAAVDAYALGVTLWELATGQAFDRPPGSPAAHARHVAERTGQVPAELRDLLGSLLSWEPADRPTADAIRARLDALPVAGESLAGFARRVVPPLLDGRRPDPTGALPSRVLLDAPDSGVSLVPTAPVPPPQPRSPALVVLGGAALVGVGAVLVAGLASLAAANWWSARAPGEQPPALEVPAEPPREVAEEPVPPPAAEPAVAATPKPETRRSTRREPASPEPAPPEPTTAPLATREPASAAPTASAAAPAASTTIKVTADQLGARVFLDGKAVGRTPLAGLSVTDGSHTLMVEGPASALSRPIDVGPGRPMRYHCRLSQNDWQVE